MMSAKQHFHILRNPLDSDYTRRDTAWCGEDTTHARFRFTGLDGLMMASRNGSPLKPCPHCVDLAVAGFHAAVDAMEARP